jgi:hypothetical protein
VEAMRLSGSFEEFKAKLKRVRYRSGVVAFEMRNHFFTDWLAFNRGFIEDATVQVGGRSIKKVDKILNTKGNGTYFMHGIEPRAREISYIPSDAVDDNLLGKLRTGDYAGIYSEVPGLDVSHVGIVVEMAGVVRLRHASSQDIHRKVLDADFKTYLTEKPGFMLFRPRTPIT